MIGTQEIQRGPAQAAWTAVGEIRRGEDLARLRPEWDGLMDRSGAGPFNAWEWLYPWVRRIGVDRALLVLTARARDGRLVGLLPLGIEERRVLGKPVRRLSFLGETHVGSDYLDVVAERGLEEPLSRAFASALRERREWWDLVDLVDLDAGSPTLSALRHEFRDCAVRVSERFACPFEPLDPAEGFDAFLKRTGRRDNYLRRRKWLEKQPGWRIDKVGAPAALARPLADFFRLHRLRWAGEGGSQGIRGPGVESFHRDATQLLAERQQLQMYTMRMGEQAIASVYAIVHGGKFIYYQSGYDPEWRSKSVGLVLVGETFRDAFSQGLREYDFLRGTEAYKADWTSRQRKTVSIRIVPGDGPGHWLDGAERGAKEIRELAKKVLPAGIAERIRRARRRNAEI